ncbi:MAG: 3-phosphoshikimate 1-carboxyvinyltransferase [Acidimicrobiia bacterium]|nr:MAG: 3-phosphoshikimate 1-carboxyvinyltransferase [Acidimicrobiia bacterium]
MTDLTLSGPGGPFTASVDVPGDKSLSHRALLFAAIAEGDSLITGLGPGEDIQTTATALHALGVSVSGQQIRSPGIANWTTPESPIDCGNSGTTIRLLAGVLSTSHVKTTLVGDASLSQRPMGRLIQPLRSLGGAFATSKGATPPLDVGGIEDAESANVTIDIASAQVRTAFELAALASDGPSTIDSPSGFRDHTERWLSAVGRGEWETDTRFRIDPGPIPPSQYGVPGDPSSAAFMWACAAIEPGAAVTTPQISLNPGRLGFLQILEQMGTRVVARVTGATGGDPVGDVTVTGGRLRGTSIEGDLVASALDELPLVAVLGAYAEGITSVRDATELRTKESDRIEAVVAMIRALGGGIEPKSDGFDVVGTGFLDGGVVETALDHRIAMAGAVAATKANQPVVIKDASIVSVSWPGFYAALEGLWS